MDILASRKIELYMGAKCKLPKVRFSARILGGFPRFDLHASTCGINKDQNMKGNIIIDQELCKGCGLCIAFCPQKTIVLSDRLNAAGYLPSTFKSNSECTGCASCATVCPEVAIEVYRG